MNTRNYDIISDYLNNNIVVENKDSMTKCLLDYDESSDDYDEDFVCEESTSEESTSEESTSEEESSEEESSEEESSEEESKTINSRDVKETQISPKILKILANTTFPKVEKDEDNLLNAEEFLNTSTDAMYLTMDEEVLKTYKTLLSDNVPDLKKMLSTIPNVKKRVKLLEKYMCFVQCDVYTPEWFEVRNELRRLYKRYQHVLENNIVPVLDEVDYTKSIKYKILDLNTSNDVKAVIMKKYKEYKGCIETEEGSKIKKWITNALELPFDNHKLITTCEKDVYLNFIKLELDRLIYGMDEVKEQLLLFLNNRLHHPDKKGANIALVGEPGVGKTFIVRILSEILQYPFCQISLGGITNSEFLKGHDYTYIGSQPGVITKSMMKMKNNNGIIFFDEFDKISNNKDVVSALLHITDVEQNHEFKDNYFPEISIDLSNVLWFYSLNEEPTSRPLKDRLHIIHIPKYTTKDLKNITRQFLIPKICKSIGLDGDNFTISERAIERVLFGVNGIRELERQLRKIINKLYFVYKNKKLSKSLSFKNTIVEQLPFEITSEVVMYLESKKTSNNWEHLYM
jgi:ATP-dependent Lon protease